MVRYFLISLACSLSSQGNVGSFSEESTQVDSLFGDPEHYNQNDSQHDGGGNRVLPRPVLSQVAEEIFVQQACVFDHNGSTIVHHAAKSTSTCNSSQAVKQALIEQLWTLLLNLASRVLGGVRKVDDLKMARFLASIRCRKLQQVTIASVAVKFLRSVLG
jgi:hypothetical protein